MQKILIIEDEHEMVRGLRDILEFEGYEVLSAETAKEVDRFSLAAMLAFVVLCVAAGTLPGYFIDALGPAAQVVVGAHMPTQRALDWLTIVPIAESEGVVTIAVADPFDIH